MAAVFQKPGEQMPLETTTGGLSFRAVFIGLICVGLTAFVTPYSDLLLRGTWMACSHLPMAPLLVFGILILFVNTALRRISPQWCLRQAELYVVYIMMLVGALVPSFGITAYLIPTISGANYYATPENKWVETFYRHIQPWMVPFDPTSNDPTAQLSMKQFYEGIPPNQAIPWSIWIRPLASWSIFGFGLFFVWMCLSTILRRQWVDNEKLPFPLVQLPVEMARQGDKFCWAGNPFFRSRAMWFGFAFATLIHSMNALHRYYPSIPQLVLFVDLHQYLVTFPWNQVGVLWLVVHFSVIGFSFLLSSELSFSLWFFFIFFKGLEVITAAHGMQHKEMPNYPVAEFAAHQMLGAFLVFFCYMVYLSRKQIADVARKAFTAARDVDDSNESLSYRTAFFGLLLGTVFLSGWCHLAGMSFPLALISFAMFYLIAISLSRFVAEGGLLFVQAPFRPSDLIGSIAGIGSIGAQNITTLTFVERIFIFDLRGFLMPSLLDSMKMTDAARLNRRKLTIALVLAIIVAVIVSYVTVIWIGYRQGGGVNLSAWFFNGSPISCFDTLKERIVTPRPKDWSGATFTVIGAAVTMLLAYMRVTFSWWPLHPMGYAMGPSWPMIQLWFSIMVGWSLKTMILRYGGMKGFVRARPFFLGLVLGEFAMAGFWLAVNALTDVKDFRIFLN
ncbi:MAG: hypothetical protein Q7T82_08470 [Armatimonadota bacterium]|nr:hypothetical protein [Armatimonadota bacterium]